MGMETQDGVAIGLFGAVAAKTIEAFVRVFGTRKERAAAESGAAQLALQIARQEREETEKVRGQRDDCHVRLDALTDEMRAVQENIRTCDDRSESQQQEIETQRERIESQQIEITCYTIST